MAHEILINATLVTQDNCAQIYEFIINGDLTIVECVYVESISEGIISPVPDASRALKGVLFELNHVRVNPRLDNSVIINILTRALQQVGVSVTNGADSNEMAICYKPLGEISDNVRFYFHEDGKMIFLSPALRPRVVTSNSAEGNSKQGLTH